MVEELAEGHQEEIVPEGVRHVDGDALRIERLLPHDVADQTRARQGRRAVRGSLRKHMPRDPCGVGQRSRKGALYRGLDLAPSVPCNQRPIDLAHHVRHEQLFEPPDGIASLLERHDIRRFVCLRVLP